MMEVNVIGLEEIVPQTRKMFDDGWRLVTQSLVDLGDEGFDLFYHYDKELELQHYKVKVPKGTAIPSISGIYFAALLVENENRDLFGVSYDGLVLDFNRSLYLEEAGEPMNAPFCKISTFTTPKKSED